MVCGIEVAIVAATEIRNCLVQDQEPVDLRGRPNCESGREDIERSRAQKATSTAMAILGTDSPGTEFLTGVDFAAIPGFENSVSSGSNKPMISVLMLAWNHAE